MKICLLSKVIKKSAKYILPINTDIAYKLTSKGLLTDPTQEDYQSPFVLTHLLHGCISQCVLARYVPIN